jgi:hypothetical protein
MTKEMAMSCEHVLELSPGAEGEIELRFAKGEHTNFTVALAAVDLESGTVELALDDMWHGYEMRQFMKDSGRWRPIQAGEDGYVHAVVGLGAGKHLNISSDLALIHSLDLTDVVWKEGRLRLTFREIA